MKTTTIFTTTFALTLAILPMRSAFAADYTDAQIAQIVKDADQAEISAAQMAKSHAQNPEVKQFAQHMIDDHSANKAQEKVLAKQLSMKPQASDESRTLEKTAKAKEDNLRDAKGSAFDQAYIDSQVQMHSQLLNDLTTTYIPQAKNAEFKSFLETTKQHVSDHLADAQKIQASLGAKSGTGTSQQ